MESSFAFSRRSLLRVAAAAVAAAVAVVGSQQQQLGELRQSREHFRSDAEGKKNRLSALILPID